jgi:hypothetical protein
MQLLLGRPLRCCIQAQLHILLRLAAAVPGTYAISAVQLKTYVLKQRAVGMQPQQAQLTVGAQHQHLQLVEAADCFWDGASQEVPAEVQVGQTLCMQHLQLRYDAAQLSRNIAAT